MRAAGVLARYGDLTVTRTHLHTDNGAQWPVTGLHAWVEDGVGISHLHVEGPGVGFLRSVGHKRDKNGPITMRQFATVFNAQATRPPAAAD